MMVLYLGTEIFVKKMKVLYLGMENMIVNVCHSERKMADSLLVAQNDNVILNVLS